MSTFLAVVVWFCALGFAATFAETQLSEATNRTEQRQIESDSQPVHYAKRPSCVITIPEDEADGLTKLLNEFINFFVSKSETVAVDSPWNKTSSFVLNCTTGISELETSVWLILNRVWLATSCQFSDEEYDEAIREVEDEGDKVLITLRNVDVRLRDVTIKTDYYESTVTKVRVILEQTIKKMREAQGMGRCDSSGVKNLTENFEDALEEIKSQKNDTAALHEETREALGTTKALKEEMDKTLKILMTRGGELEEYKTATQTTIAGQSKKIGELEEYKNSTLKVFAGQSKKIQELEEYKTSTQAAIAEQSKKIAELTTSRNVLEETLVTRGEEFEEYKNATQATIAGQSKKIGELEEYKTSTQAAIAEQSKKITELTTSRTVVEETLVSRGKELEEYKTKTSQLIQKQAEQIREQAELLTIVKTRLFSKELQAYLSSGWAGISGRAVTLENVDYKGEFLYLARNPTDRNASVYNDGATLAVGAERLRESAFLWEFVPLPEEGKSSFYLRNKLNEQNPLASKKESDWGRWNYISLEIVSSPESAQPKQLLIYMKETVVYNKYYYHPNSIPNTNSERNGRAISWSSSLSSVGSEWIVHFAS